MQNIHCAFASANTAIVEVAPDFGPLHSEVMGESFRMRNGEILPPESPGLGISLDQETLEKYPFVSGSGEFNSVPGKVMED